MLFQLQIYTNFESNSQHIPTSMIAFCSCFSCKYIQISKAIHNYLRFRLCFSSVVSAANIYKFRKQFTTDISAIYYILQLFQLQIYTNFESNSQRILSLCSRQDVVSAANIYKKIPTNDVFNFYVSGASPHLALRCGGLRNNAVRAYYFA